MLRILLGVIAAILLATLPARSAEPELGEFWTLKPAEIRQLVAAPQVMVTRKAGGWDAYCRCPVVLRANEIPDRVKWAVIAIEDRRFRDHGGVDWLSLPRIVTSGFRHGASTIPMQLAKNLLLHDLRSSGDRFARKQLEVRAALALDGALDKDELLAAYLNQVEFGGREIVGLYRAARHYFRKEPRDLTLFEAALLAGMLKAPATYHPVDPRRRESAHKRARLVLDMMVQQGFIKEAARRRAVKDGVRPGLLPAFAIRPQAFVEWVFQTWGPPNVRDGETIRFFVTLDPREQRAAQSHLADVAREGALPAGYDAAAVVMAGDGRVRAMIGSLDWSRSQFNAATKAAVQPGSTAKLALAVAACERGKGPNSRVLDAPITADWPANGTLGYKGMTTLRDVIAASRNAGAVRLAGDVGVGNVAAASRRLGLDPGPQPDAGMVLGSYSTNVLAVTSAYAALANGGLRPIPTGILAAVDGHGRLRTPMIAPERVRAVATRCVAPVRGMLEEVVRVGTGRRAALPRSRAYGKTGTSTGNADAWFVGGSRGRVMGIWMGRPRGSDGPAIAGGDAPADLFRRVMARLETIDDERRQRQKLKVPPGAPVVARGAEPTPRDTRRAATTMRATARPAPVPKPRKATIATARPGPVPNARATTIPHARPPPLPKARPQAAVKSTVAVSPTLPRPRPPQPPGNRSAL